MIAGDGPDRERLERLASPLNGQVEFTGRVDDERLADLYARCLAVFYAPVDEDYGMVPFEAFLSEKPVVTTTDAGGPLEIVHDRETGVVVAPDPREVAEACAYLGGARRRGEGLGPRRQGGRRARHLGRLHRRAALVKVAYYSPMPPSRSGIADYSALLLPALRERVEEIVLAEPGKRRAGRGRRALPRRQRPRRARLDRRRAARAARRRRPARVRPAPPDRRDHDRPRRRARRTSTRWSASGGVVGRLLGLGVLDNLLPLLWETEPERFPLAGTVLDLATGVIVHSRYVEERVREAGYAGRLWRDPAPGLAGATTSCRPTSTGDPLVGCFGHLNMNKRIPQLLEAFALLREAAARRAAAARRRGGRAVRPRAAASSGSGSAARR